MMLSRMSQASPGASLPPYQHPSLREGLATKPADISEKELLPGQKTLTPIWNKKMFHTTPGDLFQKMANTTCYRLEKNKDYSDKQHQKMHHLQSLQTCSIALQKALEDIPPDLNRLKEYVSEAGLIRIVMKDHDRAPSSLDIRVLQHASRDISAVPSRLSPLPDPKSSLGYSGTLTIQDIAIEITGEMSLNDIQKAICKAGQRVTGLQKGFTAFIMQTNREALTGSAVSLDPEAPHDPPCDARASEAASQNSLLTGDIETCWSLRIQALYSGEPLDIRASQDDFLEALNLAKSENNAQDIAMIARILGQDFTSPSGVLDDAISGLEIKIDTRCPLHQDFVMHFSKSELPPEVQYKITDALAKAGETMNLAQQLTARDERGRPLDGADLVTHSGAAELKIALQSALQDRYIRRASSLFQSEHPGDEAPTLQALFDRPNAADLIKTFREKASSAARRFIREADLSKKQMLSAYDRTQKEGHKLNKSLENSASQIYTTYWKAERTQAQSEMRREMQDTFKRMKKDREERQKKTF